MCLPLLYVKLRYVDYEVDCFLRQMLKSYFPSLSLYVSLSLCLFLSLKE